MDNKRQIADTYLELVKKKNIDKITIKDIVDGCSVTRQSFYYHFRDIFDLMEWIMNEECKAALEHTLKAESLYEAIKHILKLLFDRYDIIMAMLESKERQRVERLFIKNAREYLMNFYLHSNAERITKYELETALDFYSFAIAGYITGLCERKDYDVDRAALQLMKLINAKIILYKGKT